MPKIKVPTAPKEPRPLSTTKKTARMKNVVPPRAKSRRLPGRLKGLVKRRPAGISQAFREAFGASDDEVSVY